MRLPINKRFDRLDVFQTRLTMNDALIYEMLFYAAGQVR